MDDQKQPQPTPNGLSPGQMWHTYQRYPYLLAKVVLFLLVVTALIFVMRSVEAVLFPLFASLLIAYLLDPAVDWFEERKVSRPVAISLFLFAGIVATALFALVLYPTVVRTASMIVDRLPALAEVIQTQTLPWLRERGVEVPQTLSDAFEEYGETVKNSLPNIAQKVSGWIGGVLSGAGGVLASLLNIVMIPIFTFYFLRDFDQMTAAIGKYLPTSRRDFLLDRTLKADEVVGAWFRGQVEVAGILAALYAVGLGGLFGWLGIGMLSGVAIGILTGLLNVIPYFGVLIGIVLSSLLVLIDWHGWAGPIGVVVVFSVVQVLEGYVITPKIVGEKVGLSPVTVIIVLLLGSELFGLLGVLLAIPVAGVVRVLLPDILAVYTSSPFFTGKLPYELDSQDDPTPSAGATDAQHQTSKTTSPAATDAPAPEPASPEDVAAKAAVAEADAHDTPPTDPEHAKNAQTEENSADVGSENAEDDSMS
ncbi:MAG: AI-2E family transporter [bacterium]